MTLLNGHEAAVRAFNSHPITVIVARGLATLGIAAMLYLANETRQFAKDGLEISNRNAAALSAMSALVDVKTEDRFRRREFDHEMLPRDAELHDHEDRIRALEERRKR